MKSKPFSFLNIIQLIIIVLLIIFLAWVVRQEATKSTLGQEFYIQWAAGRQLVFENRNPYDSEIYIPDNITNLNSNQQYNTPLYSMLVVLPFVLIEQYDTAFFAWLLFNEFCVLILFVSIVKLIDWKFKNPVYLVIVTFLLMSKISFDAFLSGSLIISTSLFLVLSFLALKSEKNELAGFLFALTTIQIHIYILIYLLAIVWGISKRRWGYIIWFLAGITILSIVSAFVVPSWFVDYARILVNFKSNFNLWTPGEILLDWLPGIGKQLGWGLTLVMGLYLLLEWVAVRKQESKWLIWTVCMTITVSHLIGLAVNPQEYFLLEIPLILVLSVWVQRTGIIGKRIMTASVIGLFALQWFLYFRNSAIGSVIQPSINHFFGFPLIILVGIFWIRWWAVRPMKLYIEELKGNEMV